jgi:hypothetical protein
LEKIGDPPQTWRANKKHIKANKFIGLSIFLKLRESESQQKTQKSQSIRWLSEPFSWPFCDPCCSFTITHGKKLEESSSRRKINTIITDEKNWNLLPVRVWAKIHENRTQTRTGSTL